MSFSFGAEWAIMEEIELWFWKGVVKLGFQCDTIEGLTGDSGLSLEFFDNPGVLNGITSFDFVITA